MEINLTEHAKRRMNERGIEIDWILEVLQSPALVEPDPGDDGRFRAWGPVAQRDGRMLRVVYVPTQLGFRIISAFLDRSPPRSIRT